MVAVPVHSLVDAIVEADEDEPGRAELRGEIDGLKAGVAAGAYLPRDGS